MHDRCPPPGQRRGLRETGADEPLTAARALALIASWTDLSPTRHRDLISDVKRVIAMIGLPPGTVLLTSPFLRAHWLDSTATRHGVSEYRMRNLRSSVRYIRRRTGTMDPRDIPLLPAWTDVLQGLDPHARDALGPVARYASLRAILPERMHAAAADYLTHLVEQTLTPRPRKVFGGMRRAWNRHCAQWSGQPMPAGAEAFHLPLRRLHPQLQKDLRDFGTRLTASLLQTPYDDADILDEASEAAACPRPLRASSAALRQDHARWAASALVASGVPVEAVTSLAELVTPIERARIILRTFYVRAGEKPSAAGMHVAEVLLMIARYHARSPQQDIARIRRWSAPVRLTYQRMTAKNETRVRAAMQPYHEEKLRELPRALRDVAGRLLADSPRQACAAAMRGVVVLFLQARPLRLANLCGLRLGHHLQRDDPRGGRITRIWIPAEETKNNREINLPVPRPLADQLEDWLRVFRPLIAAPDCIYLFPGHGTGNRPVTPQAMREAVKGVTRQYVGVELSPHQFRHLSACVFLDENPGQYEPVRQLLNHASVETAARSYAGIEHAATARRYDEVILYRRHRRKRPKADGASKRRTREAKD